MLVLIMAAGIAVTALAVTGTVLLHRRFRGPVIVPAAPPAAPAPQAGGATGPALTAGKQPVRVLGHTIWGAP